MKRVVLYEGESEYGAYRIIERVYEGRPARVLFSDRNVPQSGLALDDDPELLFDYNQRFLEIALSVQPRSVLVIGGGMLTLPTALFQHFPQADINVVEIDSLLPPLARMYFGAADDSQITVHVEDGRDYMARATKRYDLIIVDAFSGFTIAHPLLASDIMQRYKACLTDRGIVAVNFIARYHTYRPAQAHELYHTFSGVFNEVLLYPADSHYSKYAEQNILLIAGDIEPSLDYLHSRPVTLLT